MLDYLDYVKRHTGLWVPKPLGFAQRRCCCGCDYGDGASFNDDFSTDKSGWSCSGTCNRVDNALEISGAGFPAYTRQLCRPGLNGLVAAVEAKATIGASGQTVAVGFISAAGFTLEASIFAANYRRWPGVVDTGTAKSAGDTLKVEIEDSSAGGGDYDVTYFVNGVEVSSLTSYAITIDDPFLAGLFTTQQTGGGTNGIFDDYAYTSNWPNL